MILNSIVGYTTRLVTNSTLSTFWERMFKLHLPVLSIEIYNCTATKRALSTIWMYLRRTRGDLLRSLFLLSKRSSDQLFSNTKHKKIVNSIASKYRNVANWKGKCDKSIRHFFPVQFDKYTTKREPGEFILRHITQEHAKRSRAKKEATSLRKTMTASYYTYK